MWELVLGKYSASIKEKPRGAGASEMLPCEAKKDKVQQMKPKELFSCVKHILNKLPPEMFQVLMAELAVDTEESWRMSLTSCWRFVLYKLKSKPQTTQQSVENEHLNN